MNYQVNFSKNAKKDILRHQKSGNKKLLEKLDQLLDELEEHPETGTGKPERLKGNLSGMWFRRINHEHRLIYLIEGDRVVVSVLTAYGHY